MANTPSQSQSGLQPSRGPAKRAQGLDPEVTAQPRSIAEELALEDPTIDEGLSVDPEELGARYLSDAVEQGDFSSELPGQTEASLLDGPAGDEALSGPNFEADRTIWEQTVDLTLQSADGRDLRAPAFVPDDDFEERGGPTIEEMKTAPVEVDASVMREGSLFDRADGDATANESEPDEDRWQPQQKLRPSFERPVERAVSRIGSLQAGPARIAHGVLIGAANLLRRLARRLERAPQQALPERKRAPVRADEPSIPHLPIG